MPLKGCSFSNLFSISVRAGMKDRTHSIFFLPDGAREASLILLMLFSFPRIIVFQVSSSVGSHSYVNGCRAAVDILMCLYKYLSTIFCTSNRTRSLSIVRSSYFLMTNFPSIMTDSTSDPFAE